MKHLILSLLLSACAADVGKNNSHELERDNTNLKLQIQQLTIQRNTYFDSAAAAQKSLEQCYKSRP